MANNRMVLVNRRTGAEVYIAKYYPSTGWYVVDDNLKATLDAAFTKADFGTDEWPNAGRERGEKKETAFGGMWGDEEWAIEYVSHVRELLIPIGEQR